MNQIKLTHLPLVALRAFEAAGRLGTMTAASVELCVTPGAVSRQVRLLEKSLDVDLFAGPKNSPKLTEQGLQLLPIVSSAMTQMLVGLNTIKLANKKSVTVSCLNTFAIRCLIPRLYLFNVSFPDIDIQLTTTSGNEINDHYDVAIGVTLMPEDQNSDMELLFHEKIGPVMSAETLANNPIKQTEDLSALDLLTSRTRLDAWDSWCNLTKKEVLPVTKRNFDHLYFVLEATLGGLGFCIAPQHLVTEDVKTGRLKAPLNFVESGYSYIIYQPDKHHDNSTQFVQWLKEQFKEAAVSV